MNTDGALGQRKNLPNVMCCSLSLRYVQRGAGGCMVTGQSFPRVAGWL